MLHLGTIKGTTITVDANFLFLILLFVVLNYNAQLGIHYALIWIPVLFLSVLIHELAHAAMIGIFGYGSSEIVLTGMGGVTMNRRKAKAWHDLLISLAGPFSSFGLAFLCQLLIARVPVVQTDKMLQVFIPLMAAANFWWGLFNLIPVAPLDGGHAVREFLNIFLRDRTSFIISSWVAFIGGGGIAVWMFIQKQFFIALYIAFFVYMAWQRWQYFRNSGTPGD
jgi:Zn-dependent protease